MIMKKNIITLFSIFFILVLSSCTKDFENINTNPNAPISAEPEFLLRKVIYDFGEQMSFEGFTAGNLLGQYFTEVDFNLFDRHSLSEPQIGGNPWPIIYTNLRDNEILLNQAQAQLAHKVYEGPALVLKVYMTAMLTDIFGDVPYSQALKGKEGIIHPEYDNQQDIYLGEGGIFDNLEKAVESMTNYSGVESLKGDILYQGELKAWIKFANSLRLKYLMRISNKVDVQDALNDLINEGNYMTSNSDNATFDFTNSPPNNFRMATARVGDFNLFVMSETIQEAMEYYNDPRVATFFRPAEASGDFNGLLNGQDASNTSITLADYSLTGMVFREQTGLLDANFMTSWEVQFLLAEAAQKNWISLDAQSLYEEGVRQAFEYWQTDLPTDYLTDGNAVFNTNDNALEQIITQKWLASIINGYEGWIEYRRTGFPILKTLAASLNNDLIPVRMPYPIDEEATNNVNFNKAASATNGNSINAPVWWDN